jgi:hypothetical protein
MIDMLQSVWNQEAHDQLNHGQLLDVQGSSDEVLADVAGPSGGCVWMGVG